MAQIETEQNAYEAHEYLKGVKTEGNAQFQHDFDTYRKQFSLT